jgi:hypothetical protein
VLLRGVRIWLHVRSYLPGRHTTIPEHMPKAHRAHLEWSPSRLIGWGATIGRHTEALVQALLGDGAYALKRSETAPALRTA